MWKNYQMTTNQDQRGSRGGGGSKSHFGVLGGQKSGECHDLQSNIFIINVGGKMHY